MSCFERPDRSGKPEVPERLLRLDRELKIERKKATDSVYAVRGGEFGEDYRFEIRFVRIHKNLFSATTYIAGKRHCRFADTPSTAYAQLIRTVSVITSRMSYEANLSKNLESMVQEYGR